MERVADHATNIAEMVDLPGRGQDGPAHVGVRTTGMYTLSVSADRRYQLQSEEANRRIDALLEQLRVPEVDVAALRGDAHHRAQDVRGRGRRGRSQDRATTRSRRSGTGSRSSRPWRHVRKVTVFGSARTPRGAPDLAAGLRVRQAHGRRRVDGDDRRGRRRHGLGPGRGAGASARSASISGCPSSRTPNPWIAADPKLISFKYFFTRKLFLVREAHAMAFLPGRLRHRATRPSRR